jgi:hypothetical protein
MALRVRLPEDRKMHLMSGRSDEMDRARALFGENLHSLGKDHPATVNATIDLAEAYRKSGSGSRAQELLTAALEVCRRRWGEDDPYTQRAAHDLAIVLYEGDDLAAAKALQREVLESTLRNYGAGEQSALTASCELASTLRELGEWTELAAVEAQVVSILTRLYGQDHRMTRVAKAAQARTLRKLGRIEEARAIAHDAHAGAVRSALTALGFGGGGRAGARRGAQHPHPGVPS